MILEVVILQVKANETDNFESSFKVASAIICQMKGYIEHELQKCMEVENKYILLIKWETLEDHIIGFRNSEAYQQWKDLLHHFYEPFPVVEHFNLVCQYKSNSIINNN